MRFIKWSDAMDHALAKSVRYSDRYRVTKGHGLLGDAISPRPLWIVRPAEVRV